MQRFERSFDVIPQYIRPREDIDRQLHPVGRSSYAEQFAFAAGHAYYDGVSGIDFTVDLPAGGLVVIQASGTAWCGSASPTDLWVNLNFDGSSIGSLNARTVNCDVGRYTLNSVFAVVRFADAGQHSIAFPTGKGAR